MIDPVIPGAMTIAADNPQFIVDPELQSQIAPLTTEEATMLEENIIADGFVREPLTIWGETIVDGHHRWVILQHNPDIPFTIQVKDFPDKLSAIDWMICNQLGRRNVTDEQRTYLLGKMYDARKHSNGGNRGNQYTKVAGGQNDHLPKDKVAKQIAKEQHVSEATVRRAARYSKGVDAAEAVSPGFKQKVLSGELNANIADISDLRNLPEAEILDSVQHIESGERPRNSQKPPKGSANRSSLLPERNQIPNSFEQSVPSSPAPNSPPHGIESTVKAHRYCPVDDPRIIPEDGAATKGLERIAESNRKMRIISDDDDEITVEDILLEFVLAREDAEQLLRSVWDRNFDLIMENPEKFLEQLTIMSESVKTMKKECKAHERSVS